MKSAERHLARLSGHFRPGSRAGAGVWLVASLLAGCAELPRATAPLVARAGGLPFTVERHVLPGPVTAAVVKIDLRDPRVKVEVALAGDFETNREDHCATPLDTTSAIARRRDFDITLNASFFGARDQRESNGTKVRYFIGNCGNPAGWHFSAGRLVSSPLGDKLRAALVVDADGKVSLHADLAALPPKTRFAVSGNAMMLTAGKATPPAVDALRHPLSTVGLSADGRTLILAAVDGRQEGSRGATLAELAEMMTAWGAHEAINLDGGGSTALVIKDPGSGVQAVVNQPSDLSSLKIPVRGERPVADVIGIRIR